jgi:hypothetical protein
MTAGSLPLTDVDQALFTASTDGRAALSFFVRNKASSTADALVNIPGLHAAGQYALIPAGETLVFTARALQGAGEVRGAITSVLAHRSAASATVDFGVLAV